MIRYAAIILIAFVGCDRPKPPPPATPSTTSRPAAEPSSVVVSTVAVLSPDREARLAADGLGTIYWAVDDSGVSVLRAGETPQASLLTAGRIGRELGAVAVSGSFVTLLGEAKDVWFVFRGREGRRPLVLLGRYDADGDRVSIVADTAALQKHSGMDASIALAEISLARVGGTPILWLRHSDRSTILDLTPGGATLRLDRLLDDAGRPLGAAAVKMIPLGDGDALHLLDDERARLLRINPAGQAVVRLPLPSGGNYLAAAMVAGRTAMFVVERPVGIGRFGPGDTSTLPFKAPALLLVRGDQARPLDRTTWQLPSELDASAIRLTAMTAAGDDLLAYDAPSGRLLRLELR